MKEISPISPADWNFESVPSSEIVACCLWEFARESPTIQIFADMRWCHVRNVVFRKEYQRNPKLKGKHDREAEKIRARSQREAFNYDGFASKLWQTDYPLIKIYDAVMSHVGTDAIGWQQLPRRMRAQLSKHGGESIMVNPITDAYVCELEELWKRNSANLVEARSEAGEENYDCEQGALWETTNSIEAFADQADSLHKLTAAVTIDFSRFTDREIIEAFRAWLRQHRPKRYRTPRKIFTASRQKGRKLIEYQVALERLGLMRLLHWYSPVELQTELPEAWAKIFPKESDFRREIREACKFFRKLFPFIPKTERPSSEQRKGVWLPPMLKAADEVAREMGLQGA